MYLTVGEISKVLGISNEMIRFYIREGIIIPTKNKENNYWQYSSSDVMYLSDILFYRNLDLPLKDIKKIFNGLKVEEIGDIIKDRKKETMGLIQKYEKILNKLEEWETAYNEELSLLGRYEIGSMPPELRKEGYYDEEKHFAEYLKSGINISMDDWIIVSLSFYCNINEKDIKIKRYLSLSKTLETEKNNSGCDVIEESADHCIYTQVHFSENIFDMINPIIDYAEKAGIELTGDIYGRENTNYYEQGKRLGIYKVYALIK